MLYLIKLFLNYNRLILNYLNPKKQHSLSKHKTMIQNFGMLLEYPKSNITKSESRKA